MTLLYPTDGQNHEYFTKTDKSLYKLYNLPVLSKTAPNTMIQNRLEAMFALKENEGTIVTLFKVHLIFIELFINPLLF